MVGKREQTQTLNFFLVLTCLSVWARSVPSPACRINLGLSNICLPTSSWLVFNWPIHLPVSRGRLSKDTSHPLTSACHVGSRNIVSSRTAYAHKISDLQVSLVILNYNECLCLVIRWLLSDSSIYSINLRWALQWYYNSRQCNMISVNVPTMTNSPAI